MTDVQTPPSGTQPQEQVQPVNPEDLSETEKLLAEKQAAIEAEAKDLLEPGVTPEPQKQPEQPQQQQPAPAPQEPPAQPQTPPPAQPDYKEKFQQSAREVPVILEREKQAKARIEQLTNINITEDELRRIYPDWDSFNDIEKRAFRETALANKKANLAMNTAFNLMEQQAWEADFARVLKANPKLVGREEEFKAYAYKPTHKNVPLDVLVKSFLFDLPQESPTSQTPGLEKGSGGPRGGETPGELSEEQLAQLRVSDPKAYRQALVNESRKEAQRK